MTDGGIEPRRARAHESTINICAWSINIIRPRVISETRICFRRRGVPEVIIPLLTIGGPIRSCYGGARARARVRIGRNLINIIYQARDVLIYVAEIKVHWKFTRERSPRLFVASREREHGTDRYRLELRNEKRLLDVLDFEIDDFAAIPTSIFTQQVAAYVYTSRGERCARDM